MNDASHIIQCSPIDRQSGVIAGEQLILNDLIVGIEIDGFDLPARDHDVVNRDMLQFEKVEQHALVFLADEMSCFQHQGLEFVNADFMTGILRSGLESQDDKKRLYEKIDEPYQGIKNSQQ